MEDVSERSYERLAPSDLERIAAVAFRTLSAIFDRAPVAGLYRDRLLLIALAQGSALHYLNGTNGLKDIDVWAFFAAGLTKPFPHRKRWCVDFGPSRFGRHPADLGYSGRRLDLMGRSIAATVGEPPQQSVQRWLASKNRSAIELRKKPMFLLFPDAFFGERLN
ncbi:MULTISPECIES: hypothetical protein [unclassified Sinorhizobium]|uniref:hypothetical protein n=1 Tax=unclassified Sinorhizobium TaxID=2613772 RepID=UPI0024C4629A|nr:MULTISPECIES: hypothetical protein [unclassified Sinorhizobium]MDK1373549.1 hypothetical protein [Sinorhizobium sp. 6-70]MDK1482138.1 hypothetical protein [Sinorhizobium sp. 6-117]